MSRDSRELRGEGTRDNAPGQALDATGEIVRRSYVESPSSAWSSVHPRPKRGRVKLRETTYYKNDLCPRRAGKPWGKRSVAIPTPIDPYASPVPLFMPSLMPRSLAPHPLQLPPPPPYPSLPPWPPPLPPPTSATSSPRAPGASHFFLQIADRGATRTNDHAIAPTVTAPSSNAIARSTL